MILKIKAFIYRLTGIYLAQKEEDAYLRSTEALEVLERYKKAPELCDMELETHKSLLIGLWQAEHGFYLPFNYKRFK